MFLRSEIAVGGQKSRKFPVIFPVSNEIGGERLAPDCALRHAIGTAENFRRSLRRNTRNMPLFAILTRRGILAHDVSQPRNHQVCGSGAAAGDGSDLLDSGSEGLAALRSALRLLVTGSWLAASNRAVTTLRHSLGKFSACETWDPAIC
jgi:hypothetical protein